MSAQGDYELRLDRERDAAFDAAGDEYEIELSLGDAKVSVFYIVGFAGTPFVTCVDVNSRSVDTDCFSQWQIDDWTDSIKRHLRAEAEEARQAA